MTVKDKATKVILQMRGACGGKNQGAAGWLTAASKHDGLRKAFFAVFKEKPTTQKLGVWLLKNVDTCADGYRLIGTHNTHDKAWRYKVHCPADDEEAARKAAERKRLAAERDAAREAQKARNTAEREAQAAKKQTVRDDVRDLMALVRPSDKAINRTAEALAEINAEQRAALPPTAAAQIDAQLNRAETLHGAPYLTKIRELTPPPAYAPPGAYGSSATPTTPAKATRLVVPVSLLPKHTESYDQMKARLRSERTGVSRSNDDGGMQRSVNTYRPWSPFEK